MDPKAVAKARSRLIIAEKAISDFEKCHSFADFDAAWYVFLVSSKNVWTILEQGAKTSPQSRQWLGAKHKQRRDDELLQYLYEARNDDEHGIETAVEHVPGSLAFGISGPEYSNNMEFSLATDEKGNIKHFRGKSFDGKPIGLEIKHAHVKLQAVQARGNRILQPPKAFMGNALQDSSPAAVAKLCATYLDQLVAEAAGLV